MPSKLGVAWPTRLENQWVLMKVVRAGIATETEVRQHWDIERLGDWYELLLVEREAEVQMNELQQQTQQEAQRGR
jgi:hypothetical protein